VWKQIQASKLIESFLIGLPVPAVFLYTERRTQKFLVIDGQQRLRSIFYFFEGLFGEEKKGKREVFQLKGLSERSKYFEALRHLWGFLCMGASEQVQHASAEMLKVPHAKGAP